jgi:hypothetical protein
MFSAGLLWAVLQQHTQSTGALLPMSITCFSAHDVLTGLCMHVPFRVVAAIKNMVRTMLTADKQTPPAFT